MAKVREYRFILYFLTALLCLTPLLRAEEVEDINLARSRFFIDHAVFGDSAGNRLEVYYKIFNDGLNYIKKGEKYVANYEINVIILGDKDKQITGKSIEKSYVLDKYEATRSEQGFLINQVSLPLTPGSYDLVCKLIDHNSNDVSTIETKIESYSFNRVGDISDIELVREAGEAGEGMQFKKGALTVVPSVERSLDGEAERLAFYLEVYVAEPQGEPLQLRYRVEGRREGTQIEDTISLTADSTILRLKESIGVAPLSPGDYDLKLSLVRGGQEIAQRQTRFLIKWSLGSLIKNDFEYAIEQLKYIIKKDEKKSLLDSPDSLRLQKFEEWWQSQDPTPNTPQNELRDEYYRRIRYANQYYSTVGREGWETDRGMVYVKYGEPDQVERHPFELGSKPYQIWYYYTQRRTFVFIDSRGDGDYQLQHPYDGDWRSGYGP